MKGYKGDDTIMYKASYAWIAYPTGFSATPTDDQIFCAWCKLSKAEIEKTEDSNDHVNNHAKE